MPTEYSESIWRCPNATDGAFHAVDMANLERIDKVPCIHCGEWVDLMLVNDGMANMINRLGLPSAKRNIPVFYARDDEKYQVVPASLPIDAITPRLLVICNKNGPLVSIDYDSTLEYGPEYTPDAAAKAFWEAMAFFAPNRKD